MGYNEEPCGKPQGINIHIPTTTSATLRQATGYFRDKPGIAVDTHVHRISNRLGLVETKSPNQTEFALRKTLPKQYWIVFNDLLVMHGKAVCTPVSPKCSICPITDHCKRVGVTHFR